MSIRSLLRGDCSLQSASLVPGTDGYSPTAPFVQAPDGDLYGTTEGTGLGPANGTVFKITPTGTLTNLYSFCSLSGCTDGQLPYAGLVQATDGDFYATTFAYLHKRCYFVKVIRC